MAWVPGMGNTLIYLCSAIGIKVLVHGLIPVPITSLFTWGLIVFDPIEIQFPPRNLNGNGWGQRRSEEGVSQRPMH
jgi:hypothetical protein